MSEQFDTLFDMHERLIRGALRVVPQAEMIDHMAVFRADTLPRKPLVYQHHMGGKPRDLIGTGYSGLYLLSDRVVQALRNGRFEGWTTYPVEVYGKKGIRIEGYHGFSVTGRCGLIDWSRGQKVWLPPPSCLRGRGHAAWIGMYFDPASWDGSDIFSPEGTTCTIVTEAVKNAIEKIKATNIRHERLSDCVRTWR